MQYNIFIMTGWDITFSLFCKLILEFIVIDNINLYHGFMRANVYKVSSTTQLVLNLSSSDVKHYKTAQDCSHLKVQHSSLCI